MDIYEILRVNRNASKADMQAKYQRLLDTYRLTAEYAADSDVAEAAQLKIKQLLEAGKEYGLKSQPEQVEKTSTLQEDIGALKLAVYNASSADHNPWEIISQIDDLPECAEKHYLHAMYTMRGSSNSLDAYQIAVKELGSAIKLDPTNEGYRAFLEAISEQLKDYERRQQERADKIQREKDMEARRRQELVDEQNRKEFLNTAVSLGIYAGTVCCLLWCTCQCCQGNCC